MKVVLNTEALRPPITGIGNYTFHLLEELAARDEIDEVHCFDGTQWLQAEAQLAITGAVRDHLGNKNTRLLEWALGHVRDAVARVPGAKYCYSHIMDRRFSAVAARVPGAIYHETNYALKPYAGPCITTVHDMSYKTHTGYHPPDAVARLEANLPHSIHRADRIITDSNLVREELLAHFDVPAEKVRTVYLGADHRYQPRTQAQTSEVLSRYGLTHGQYVLIAATLEPRKGIDTLLDAWPLLPEELRRAFPLVIIGSRGWHNEALLRKLSALVAEGTVHHLGYLPANELPLIFSGAAVFTYPSLYEGFGLPVLEAMSSGVPVICRDGTAMAEFAEGACLLCESGSAEELHANLQRLLSDADARKRWAGLGLSQARKFSWERCASDTIDIYKEVS